MLMISLIVSENFWTKKPLLIFNVNISVFANGV